mmetsp:Transcript_48464/g.65985  ORF Transcript_48464/g.65985 Transcript_48464/m.65985 type:complete len:106 (-) Transcript_48464:2960-3277(-)
MNSKKISSFIIDSNLKLVGLPFQKRYITWKINMLEFSVKAMFIMSLFYKIDAQKEPGHIEELGCSSRYEPYHGAAQQLRSKFSQISLRRKYFGCRIHETDLYSQN